jgi:hypothetical protein
MERLARRLRDRRSPTENTLDSGNMEMASAVPYGFDPYPVNRKEAPCQTLMNTTLWL